MTIADESVGRPSRSVGIWVLRGLLVIEGAAALLGAVIAVAALNQVGAIIRGPTQISVHLSSVVSVTGFLAFELPLIAFAVAIGLALIALSRGGSISSVATGVFVAQPVVLLALVTGAFGATTASASPGRGTAPGALLIAAVVVGAVITAMTRRRWRDSVRSSLTRNMDDDRVDWVAELRRITGTIASIAAFEAPGALPGFCAGHRVDVPSSHRLARAEVPDLVSTWSSVSTLPEREREDVMDQVAQLLRDRPEIRDADPVELPQITVALTYHLGGDAPR